MYLFAVMTEALCEQMGHPWENDWFPLSLALFLVYDVFHDWSKSVNAMCSFLICKCFLLASFLAAVIFTEKIRRGQMMAEFQPLGELIAWMLVTDKEIWLAGPNYLSSPYCPTLVIFLLI